MNRRIKLRVQIGRFCDPVAYASSRDSLGAGWNHRTINSVAFLGHIGHFPDETPVDGLGEDFEGDLHPTPEEMGETPQQIVVPSSIPPLDPNEPIPF